MENKLILPENYKQTYDKIVKMIETAKHKVFETANFQTVYLFWHIGQELKDNILNGQKAEYGKSIVKNMSKDLEFQYGRSYEKSSVFRMIQFYEEFPDFEKVATLSQQLTWLGILFYGKMVSMYQKKYWMVLLKEIMELI